MASMQPCGRRFGTGGFTLLVSPAKWGIYGFVAMPQSPPLGTNTYRVTFKLSSTGARSMHTDDLVVTVNQPTAEFPTYHSVYKDNTTWIDGKTASLDPAVLPRARDGNRNVGTHSPERTEFAKTPNHLGYDPSRKPVPARRHGGAVAPVRERMALGEEPDVHLRHDVLAGGRRG
jgi:hypothetical protein